MALNGEADHPDVEHTSQFTQLNAGSTTLPDPENDMDMFLVDANSDFVDPMMRDWESHQLTGHSYLISYPLRESTHFPCSPEFNDKNGVWALRANEQCTPDTIRTIRVYIPGSYQNGAPAAVLFAGDDDIDAGCVGCRDAIDPPASQGTVGKFGRPQSGGPGFWLTAVLMDKLIAAGRLPANMVHITNNNAQGRDIEMNTMNGAFADFLQHEVLHRVRSHPQIIADGYSLLQFTDHPKGRALIGCSAGGDQAMIQPFFRPQIIGVGLAFSATITWTSTALESNVSHPIGAADLWAQQKLYARGPKKDIRQFHHCSDHDMGTHTGRYTLPGSPTIDGNGCIAHGGQFFPTDMCNTTGPNAHVIDQNRAGRNYGFPGVGDCCNPYSDWAEGNNRSARALHDQGYAHRYLYTQNSCHCDYRMYNQVLPATLTWGFEEYMQHEPSSVHQQ